MWGVCVRERVCVCVLEYLWLDVDLLCSVGIEPAHFNLTVKMSDVAHNGVILHLLKVSGRNTGMHS